MYDVSDPRFIWVVKLMAQIGVSFDTLFSTYDSLIVKQSSLDDKLNAVVPLTALVENWLQNTKYQISPDMAQSVTSRLQFYVSQLNSKSHDEAFRSALGRLQYLIQKVNNVTANRQYY